MLDIVIRGGLIIDGTGNAPYPGDLAVKDGRIVAVGRLEGAEAAVVIDASGLAVAPGFIDMHSHSDLSLPLHPLASSSLLQGITTEVAGSCGWSLAPVKNETARSVLKGLCEALIGAIPPEIDAGGEEGTSSAGPARPEPPLGWYSFGDYLAFLETRGIGTNLYPIVGQSLIRAMVVGTERRAATPGEIRAMQALLDASLEEGARGLSTGRAYAPGGHASTEEILALAKVVARRGGLYTSHIKDESSGLIEAVDEAIRIGRESGVRVEISHHKAIGRPNFGKVGRTLAMMEEARQAGVDVTCDVYPYAFAQVFSMLSEIPGVTLRQSLEDIRALFGKAEFREKVAADLIKASAEEHGTPGYFSRPGNIKLVSVGRDHDLEGQTLAAVFGPNPLGAAEPGAKATPLEPGLARRLVGQVLDFLLAQDLHVNLAADMDEADVETVLGHPQTMVGTDAFTLDGDLGERTPIHPRHFGTFPRVLGHYGRERKLGDLGALVQKITGLPARKLGLRDRGLLARYMWADVVVFDPATIADRATAKEPYLAPVGIKWVLVNGRVAAQDGRALGVRAGMVLRR